VPAGAADEENPRRVNYIYKTAGGASEPRKRRVLLLPHLGCDGAAAGEVGEGRASGKSAPELALAAAADLIARGSPERGTQAGEVEYSSTILVLGTCVRITKFGPPLKKKQNLGPT